MGDRHRSACPHACRLGRFNEVAPSRHAARTHVSCRLKHSASEITTHIIFMSEVSIHVTVWSRAADCAWRAAHLSDIVTLSCADVHDVHGASPSAQFEIKANSKGTSHTGSQRGWS